MKITEFKARTGRTVTITSKTLTGVELEISGLGTCTKLGLGDVETLREFFQADQDEELERWRDPEYPHIFVRPNSGGSPDWVGVVKDNAEGLAYGQFRRGDYPSLDSMSIVAHRYFATHPETKPWHTPNHLEIWALTIQGCPSEAYIYREGYLNPKPAFRPVNDETRVKFAPTDPKIVDAHRIWPEGESNDN